MAALKSVMEEPRLDVPMKSTGDVSLSDWASLAPYDRHDEVVWKDKPRRAA
jgi:hypothetical protein